MYSDKQSPGSHGQNHLNQLFNAFMLRSDQQESRDVSSRLREKNLHRSEERTYGKVV